LEGQSQVPQTGGQQIEAIITTSLVVAVYVRGGTKTLQPPDSMFHPHPHRGYQPVPPTIFLAQGLVFAAFAREA
jgi:hypothetical protein